MPSAGDTFRLSISMQVPAGFASAAMDTTWDFSGLEALSQRVDTFVSVTSTPPLYWIVFIPNVVANLAMPGNAVVIPGLPVTDQYTYYMNSSSAFAEAGYAFTAAGLPFAARYNNPDRIYQFPCSAGTAWSSQSALEFTIPYTVYYSSLRNRLTTVDGWGMLLTPFGQFQTLRIKSIVAQRDSIFIDSLGAGFPIIREYVEYKWIGKDAGVPLLQINQEGMMTTAIYRDSVRMPVAPFTVDIGNDTVVSKGAILTTTAVITGGAAPYQVFWNTLDTGLSLTIPIEEEQTITAVVVDALQRFATDSRLVGVRYPPGMEEPAEDWLQVSPNPTRGEIRFGLPGITGKTGIQVLDSRGKQIRELELQVTSGECRADLSGLANGLYLLRISAGGQSYRSRVMIVK